MTRILSLLCLWLPLTGCAVHIPQPSSYTDLAVPLAAVDEARLLDVAISQFTFEPPVTDGAPDLQLADIRGAESRYMPVMLRSTLAHVDGWGAVQVVPGSSPGHDVQVTGAILDADSHTLRLKVRVTDASGAEWFDTIYTEHVGDEVYGDNSIGINDPFTGLYNRIANDMLVYVRDELDAAAIAGIRQVAELSFGNEFAPDLYGDYLVTNRKRITSITRLPPANDPAVAHLREIRLRDRAFREVLQQHYTDFAKEISNNYFEYRRQSFRELKDLHDQQTEARNDIIGGALLLGVAVATSNIDDTFATIAATTAAVTGVVKVVSGVRAYETETPFLDEIAESFAGDVITEVVALDEEVVTLTGSTEDIYGQWKEILRELFNEDRSQ